MLSRSEVALRVRVAEPAAALSLLATTDEAVVTYFSSCAADDAGAGLEAYGDRCVLELHRLLRPATAHYRRIPGIYLPSIDRCRRSVSKYSFHRWRSLNNLSVVTECRAEAYLAVGDIRRRATNELASSGTDPSAYGSPVLHC